jgi:hypothetical protein
VQQYRFKLSMLDGMIDRFMNVPYKQCVTFTACGRRVSFKLQRPAIYKLSLEVIAVCIIAVPQAVQLKTHSETVKYKYVNNNVKYAAAKHSTSVVETTTRN